MLEYNCFNGQTYRGLLGRLGPVDSVGHVQSTPRSVVAPFVRPCLFCMVPLVRLGVANVLPAKVGSAKRSFARGGRPGWTRLAWGLSSRPPHWHSFSTPLSPLLLLLPDACHRLSMLPGSLGLWMKTGAMDAQRQSIRQDAAPRSNTFVAGLLGEHIDHEMGQGLLPSVGAACVARQAFFTLKTVLAALGVGLCIADGTWRGKPGSRWIPTVMVWQTPGKGSLGRRCLRCVWTDCSWLGAVLFPGHRRIIHWGHLTTLVFSRSCLGLRA